MAFLRSGWAVVLANILVPLGILVFSSGFFPYKPLLPGLATFDEIDQNATPAIFDKVIFMVVDALRSDFVYSNESGFSFTQSLIRAGAALPFTAHASSPTVTMPRLKAMTTGSVPSFLDVILNIAESDTGSSLAYQDTWLAQLRARGDRLVMYGDDTWLKLFPGMFDRADGTTSFFVSDFTEVDNNVTRHVPDELAQSDWSAMIMHYLGLDHIGHKAGPRSPFMLSKQQEMDAIVDNIYTAIQHESHLESTLFVLCGDHGMNEAGNHGGSSAGETSPALLFISPKFETMDAPRAESPIATPDDLRFYQTVQQSDITATLAGLLGLPIPLNSLGVFIPGLLDMWESGSQKLQLLSRNARQLLKIAQSTFPSATFDAEAFSTCNPDNLSGIDEVQCTWSQAQKLLSEQHLSESEEAYPAIEQALLRFSRATQEVMSSTASNYDMSRLVAGLLILAVATSLLLPQIYHEFSRTVSTGIFLVFMVVGYGSMMFASSYVEEEQQFWYWICSGWMFYLHMRSESGSSRNSNVSRRKASSPFRWIKLATLGLIASHRVLRRWNQTGQKFTAEPDIARDFFPAHPNALWALVILTYVDSGYHLLAKMPSVAPAKLIALIIPALGFLFKLNFAANDSPELLADTPLSKLAGGWLGSLSLVLQARLVFGGLACCGLLAIVSAKRSHSTRASNALFHEALHLFLMTQSRITNVPVFLLFRTQGTMLSSLNLTGIEVTATTLILQYMTFFAFGGSNSISSVDLSSAYNGVGSYSVVCVGILTFVSNWAGPIWWISMGHLLRPPHTSENHRHDSAALFTFQVAASLLSVMAACTALRTHLFIWTVFSPKYLYSMAWAMANHVAVNILGGIGLACLWPRR
ncbi:GPI ethanolamine phosphate transferase 2 [Penicillium cosmopolitanum]|uniref:GPI ethanolamine phosphate transferase 2 n=1 Tax=Penicillium cosmopolitanum TaxID=1131564 RepID=A0A9W9W2B3_9EURO|nr:GPI ethanolamine phosphate transferase 2 [Penicillium cosmopolitanum]KAJ5397270.1 GPI ethanolamine phosphate transferase 2 [Penicillium cosmopolitanum]